MNYLKLYGESLLKEVSRSFYVTMRVLPRPMREPVSLAYLLARATDTLADTEGLAPETRLEALRALQVAILGTGDFTAVAQKRRDGEESDRNLEVGDILRVMGKLESDNPGLKVTNPQALVIEPRPTGATPGEARLLHAVPELLAWLRALSAEDAAAVRWVLDIISQGQILDIQRFELGAAPGEIRALETAKDLDDYTYRVAGCVGEFWTSLALRKLSRYADGGNDLATLGVEFGKGLQLVNILRDFPSDLEKGRCYLPASELRAVGVMDIVRLRERSGLAEKVWLQWAERARQSMENAVEYTLRLRSWRMRFACALPVALGLETLRLAQAAGIHEGQLPRGIKVPRRVVKRMMLRLLWASRSREPLRQALWENTPPINR